MMRRKNATPCLYRLRNTAARDREALIIIQTRIALNPPTGAAYAEIKLLYQPTSWEYVQFLYLANNRQNAFLADEGINLLNAWLNTGMAEPHVMATATWGTAPLPQCTAPGIPQNLTVTPA